MEYAQQTRNTVTMIEELPELSDVERSQGQGYHQMPMQGNPRPEQDPAGYGQPPTGQGSGYQHMDILPEGMADKYRRAIRQTHNMHPDSGMAPMHAAAAPQDDYIEEQPMPQQQYQPDPLHDISCLHIANHIYECPICSKFYNNDKTVYIICIVVLSIICLLLLKRVLNV
jgi:hypothetical protein